MIVSLYIVLQIRNTGIEHCDCECDVIFNHKYIQLINRESNSDLITLQDIVTRMGRWIDFKNDYKTMYPWFMESVWWVFAQLFEKGMVYKGFKVNINIII